MSRIETLIRSSVTKGVEVIAAFNRKHMAEAAGPHPFLQGLYAPMREELTLTDLEVAGTIPSAFNGRYLRIGPNPIRADARGYHWFTGDGMVHGLAIADGKAQWYRNRWIRSSAVADALGETRAPGPIHGFDTVNTNIVEIGGKTRALVEAGSYPVTLSDMFEDQAYDPFDGTLKGSFTAHPHLDPLTGENHAICYEGTSQDEIRHVVIDRAGKVIRELPIKVKHGPMIHDCAITQRYAIILDLPVTFSMKTLLGGHSFPYRWNPDHQARIGLLPRDGGAEDVIWCDMDAAYAFHVANAYDLPDGRVAIDVCAYGEMFSDHPHGPDKGSRGLERWTVDPVTKTVTVTTIDARSQEFPRIDERRFGQPHRFIHATALADTRFGFGTALYRNDLETGTRQTHDFGPGRHPGEFVFVPAWADAAEGEGWLIGLVVDMNVEKTDLIILDATRFEDAPVASIRIPHRIPAGFHGNWIPA